MNGASQQLLNQGTAAGTQQNTALFNYLINFAP